MRERCCKWCSELYTPRSGVQNYCSESCRKHAEAYLRVKKTRKPKPRPLKPGDVPTIEQVVAWQMEYKRKTGKWLGYPQALAEMRKEGYRT